MTVIVCGAGVIGASIGYFLSRRGAEVIIVERSAVACAASGKSGGFLARDWCDGSPLGPMARTSFDLHRELAASIGIDYGYRPVDTLLVGNRIEGAGAAPSRGWIDGPRATIRGALGTVDTTAQVNPAQFTEALVSESVAAGAKLKLGEVQDFVFADQPTPRIEAVVVDGAAISADAVVIALGPWTQRFTRRLALPSVYGLKGNSIVLRPTRGPVAAQAVFVETNDPEAGNISPEIFPRPDGTVYICGMADDLALPDDPLTIRPNPAAAQILQRVGGEVSSWLRDADVVSEQACYRPITDDALPVLGPIPNLKGAFVATGHNCWGILNAPATGAVMAELVMEGHATTVDTEPFSPSRFHARAGALQGDPTRTIVS